ncbi:abortive infection family protein [Hungatella sp.]|uniref:abortive infection family protein n=1 Tax=Hungatella sp. TaxID=2613924 RepID=UPI002A82D140|nr:abortive infection family protein [Hungatella sp.]
MDDKNFKNTLIKALEKKANSDVTFDNDEMWEVIMILPHCNVYLEETYLYTHQDWNTYCTILHIQAPIEKQEIFNSKKDDIFQIAKKIYGRQGDNLLTSVDIGILVEHYEIIDFSTISLTEVIRKAISDAELLMGEGKYDSAFDRVHTAFHGYLRKLLDNKGVAYEESDTLSQLYTKLHTELSSNIGSTEIAELVKKSLRSASGIIAAINEMRNRHSLSHPNDDLLQKREAEFAIRLIKDLSDYINNII